MTRIHRRALRRLGLAVGMLTILAGCPVPLPPGYERASRQNVGEQVPEFIIREQTTREDVLLTLGEPDGAASDANWLAWGSARGEGGVVFVLPAGSGGAALGTMVTEYRRVIVTFDERGVVSEAKYDTKTCPLLFGGINEHGGWEGPCLDISRP